VLKRSTPTTMIASSNDLLPIREEESADLEAKGRMRTIIKGRAIVMCAF